VTGAVREDVDCRYDSELLLVGRQTVVLLHVACSEPVHCVTPSRQCSSNTSGAAKWYAGCIIFPAKTIALIRLKANSHIPCRAHAAQIHTCHAAPMPCRVLRESPRGSRKKPNC
jgi:hypothetical protein